MYTYESGWCDGRASRRDRDIRIIKATVEWANDRWSFEVEEGDLPELDAIIAAADQEPGE